MLAEIEEFQPPVLLGFIRELLPPQPYLGNTLLPREDTIDLEYEYILGAQRKPVMAQIVSWDVESPLAARRAELGKVQGELPPIKRKSRISEKEILRFLSPRRGTSDQQDFIEQIYQDMADHVLSVLARVEWLQMQALTAPTVTYNEGGIIVNFDFGIRMDQRYDLTTGTDAAGTDLSADLGPAWTDTANSTPFSDIQFVVKRKQNRTGRRSTRMLISQKYWDNILLSAQVKGMIFETTAPNRPLFPSEVLTLFTQFNLPTPIVYDTVLQAQNADGTTADVRAMAENQVTFLDSVDPGNTLWGPTAESKVLIGTPYTQQRPGLWGAVYETDEPPAQWTKVAATTFPTLPGAEDIIQMKVGA